MNRMTYWCLDGKGCGEWRCNVRGTEVKGIEIDRLAAYENTRLEPEEISGLDIKEQAAQMALRAACSVLEQYKKAEDDGRLVVLPCKVGDTVFRIYDDCEFPGDCHTKRKCNGCEYRNLYIEEHSFCISMLGQNGKLGAPYYMTREEAEAAMGERKHE